MASKVLADLTSDAFLVSLGVISSAEGLKRHLQQSEYVKAVARALSSGEVSEQRIRQFVSELMRSFKPGDQFFYDPVLAALAVVMQNRYTPFADEYLLDLARVGRIVEFPFSSKVAQLCRAEWGTRRPCFKTKTKTFDETALEALRHTKLSYRVVFIGGPPLKRTGAIKRETNYAAS